jgi:Concanavalin A-like lectin/glucanases superfamily
MSWKFKPIRLHIFALLTFASVSVCRADLVAHYKLDETSGTTAANAVVANAGNGTIGANVVKNAAGVSGTAFTFGGGTAQADIVDMGNATGIFNQLMDVDRHGQLTISYWLKSADTGARNVAVFLGNDGATNAYIDSGIANPTETTFRAQGRNRDTTNTPGEIGELFSPASINNGAFHHIAFTVNTAVTTGVLYVDGLRVTTGSTAIQWDRFPVLNNFELGRLGRSAPADGLAGTLDDVQIYNSALNLRSVSALFNNPGLTLNDLPPIVDGDTDGDGDVDVTDFNNIRNSLGYSGLVSNADVDVRC